jgi:phospholipase C
MWRRRPLAISLARITASVTGRRALRLGIFGLMGALTLIWVHGSLPVSVSATSTSTSLGVVQSFGSGLTAGKNQITLAPPTSTTAGDMLVIIVDVRQNRALTSVSSITDSSANPWVKATFVHVRNTDAEMWYAANAASIPTTGKLTVKTANSGAIAATVIELSGVVSTAPLDVTATNSGSNALPSVGPTATTNNATEIAIGDIGWNAVVVPNGQSAGYTPLPTAQSTVSGEGVGEQAGVQVLSATGTQSYGAVLSSDEWWSGIIATFVGQSVPPTPTPSPTSTPSPTTSPTTSPTGTPSPSPTPSGSPIKHVVVIYQENHAFDEVLGDWCSLTARCNGYNVSQPVTLKGGTQLTLQQSPDVIPNVDHSVASQVTALDGGLMDGWAGVQGCGATSRLSGAIPYGCLTYYAPSQIPNLVALANQFAVSDRTFSMADSPSWGGHVYAVAATNDNFTGENPVPPKPTPPGWVAGPGWGCDSNMVTPWINPTTKVSSMEPSCIPDPSLSRANGGAFEATPAQYVPTIMDRLDAAGLPWRLYTAPSADSSYIWAVCPSFAECLDTGQANNMVATQQVLSDAASGSLPAYSLVQDGSGNTYGHVVQHNGMSMAIGDNWIGQVVSAIENGPDWDSTAIFITYDDCGCFYDHVAPGTNPDGTQQGTRVPMVIVSPYVRAGYTDSTPATFASILAYVEQTFNLAPLGVNDAAAYAYANAFDYSQTPLAPVPMQRESISPAEQQYIAAHPGDPDDPT